MANSLQDQLLKAGLIDDKQVRKVKKEQFNKQKQQPKKGAPDPNHRHLKEEQARRAERDRELNRQKNEQAERQAIQAQIRQLIESNLLSRAGGEAPYQFADNGKVKRLLVTETQRGQLSRGQLAIVRLGDQYGLVTTPVAEKVRARDERWLVCCNDAQAANNDDDAYADYKVPDDLMW
ncbi:MAG: DUF2058 domain-containing protein [Gammaproteobacteria bacterium]|nr:DUF2058 domain-containing protein [Gammaproteobacteria bacterium]MBU1655946.1 DUF2058 domain-containing protein [Gammaproteobacteria bacterium]MBU1962458.1 DUF2058 domain-containing protein [Gammaproteobacteria bacterium]